MPLYNGTVPDLKEADIIICGGGVGACVVAGRLARADSNLSILMIESGDNNATSEQSRHPALFPLNVFPESKSAKFYESKASKEVAGRHVIVPTGGTLGGGSSINIMLYSRPVEGDFDNWETPGWTSKEMLPFMKKLETYHGDGDASTHGTDGPVHITKGVFRGTRSQTEVLAAAEQLGYPTVKDLHDMRPKLGFEIAHKTVNAQGARADAASAYVHPLLDGGNHPNLQVITRSNVVRILFDDNQRAVGVEYEENPAFHQSDVPTGDRFVVKARKTVVVACGSIGTPLVLQRSGIGRRDVLEKAKVPVLVDLPGVGSDYQDHNLIFYPFKTSLTPEETLDGLWSGRMKPEDAVGNGMMGWNFCDVHGKIRPSDEEVKALGPTFQKAWDRDYKDQPNKPLVLFASGAAHLGDPTAVPVGQYFGMFAYNAYPESRGHVYITGPGCQDKYDFDCGFFKDENDLKMHVWAYKVIRDIMRRTDMYRGELEIGNPQFSPDSKAALCTVDKSLVSQGEVKKVEYTAEDDKAIEQWLREHIGTTWHSLGTCPMKAREEGGVVDRDLNVYGVSGLKVIDLSIAPKNFAANTQIPTYTIGEKGADILARELGLSLD